MLLPGAANALTARVIADLGFEALLVPGAGISNWSLGLPDLGFIGLNDVVTHTASIRDVVDIPVVVDVDTGFGSPLNVRLTVRSLERIGVNGIQIEDQVTPKRCGHFDGKQVITAEEMEMKIKAAADARADDDFLLIARTDCFATLGFQEAVDRAGRYVEAGADMTFIEAITDLDHVRKIPGLLPVPQVMNVVVGGRTPILPQSELQELGYGVVIYGNVALQGALAGMQSVLAELKQSGQVTEDSPSVARFQERQRVVQKPMFDELERRYQAPSPDAGSQEDGQLRRAAGGTSSGRA